MQGQKKKQQQQQQQQNKNKKKTKLAEIFSDQKYIYLLWFLHNNFYAKII